MLVLGLAVEDMGLTLPKVVVRELEERSRRAGVTAGEYLLDVLVRELDPAEGSEKYIEGAEELLEQAKQELERNELRQASERVWGACALSIKAYALAKEGKRLESHADLWVYKDEVAEELGDWVRTAFKLASLMHVNFYENLATKRDVEDVVKEVDKLVKAIIASLRK